jgi:hypothetical protein
VEIAMQQRRRRLRSPLHQLDLCLLNPLPELDGAQRWSALPDRTRQTLADLLTLLLFAHTGGARSSRRATAMSADKIGAQHRTRKAVLYIRQSSAHQVQYNRESQVLQYAMRDRLVQLGWSNIEVIDEDFGCSAAGGTTRAGFECMVAEVCLGKVGAVAAREVSRFARNSRDWQQLVEMCRVVDTLLIEQEAVYGPR